MKTSIITLMITGWFVWLPAYSYAQDDTSGTDQIIRAVYDVISGEAGERDWNRFRRLFTPNAMMGASITTKDGKTVFKSFTPEDYIKNNAPYLLEHSFFEKEIYRVVNAFGNIVQVFSTYEYVLGNEKARGINAIQLVYHINRWYIKDLYWQEENADYKIPAAYLPH